MFVLRAGMDAPVALVTGLDGAGWDDLLRRFVREMHLYEDSGRRGETWRAPLRPLLEAAAPRLAGARRVVFAPEEARLAPAMHASPTVGTMHASSPAMHASSPVRARYASPPKEAIPCG